MFHECLRNNSPIMEPNVVCVFIISSLWVVLVKSMHLLSFFFSYWTCQSLRHGKISHYDTLIGEGNGNPLQCSCLENSRDGGAWWAVVYGVAQSRTRLKQLSSSMILWWWIYQALFIILFIFALQRCIFEAISSEACKSRTVIAS